MQTNTPRRFIRERFEHMTQTDRMLAYLWALAFFFGLLALAATVVAEPVVVDVTTTSSVNVTATNDTLLITSNNVTYNYSLSASSQFFTIPVVTNGSREVFDVTVQGGCSVDNYTSDMKNLSDGFERMVREQLVPSQQQYTDLANLRMNDSADCQNAKNILSNEIMNQKVQMNSSFIQYNASLSLCFSSYSQAKNDMVNWRMVAYAWSIIIGALVIYIIKGWSIARWYDNYMNEKRTRPVSFFGFFKKGKGGDAAPKTPEGGK